MLSLNYVLQHSTTPAVPIIRSVPIMSQLFAVYLYARTNTSLGFKELSRIRVPACFTSKGILSVFWVQALFIARALYYGSTLYKGLCWNPWPIEVKQKLYSRGNLSISTLLKPALWARDKLENPATVPVGVCYHVTRVLDLWYLISFSSYRYRHHGSGYKKSFRGRESSF